MREVMWLGVALLFAPAARQTGEKQADDSAWTSEFHVEKGELKSTGKNPSSSSSRATSSCSRRARTGS